MSNYRPGSAGEKEEKQFKRVIAPVFGVITILALLLAFVIPSELRDNVIAAPAGWNWAGGVLLVLSGACIYKAYQAGEEGARPWTWAWIICLALGFLSAAGFYGYTY